jgi:hypothetical protein
MQGGAATVDAGALASLNVEVERLKAELAARDAALEKEKGKSKVAQGKALEIGGPGPGGCLAGLAWARPPCKCKGSCPRASVEAVCWLSSLHVCT